MGEGCGSGIPGEIKRLGVEMNWYARAVDATGPGIMFYMQEIKTGKKLHFNQYSPRDSRLELRGTRV